MAPKHGKGDTETLWSHLTTGLPVIVVVRTDDLPYWLNRIDIPDEEKVADHAVVVVGLDEQWVYANNPDFEQAPQVIDLDKFLLAWLERDYAYAVIGLEDFADSGAAVD